MELFNYLFGQEKRSFPPSDDNDFWYKSVGSSGGYVSDESVLSLAAVYACVRVIAEGVASLPLLLYRRLDNGGKEREKNHPLFRILSQQPNSWQTKYEFWEMLIGHVLLRGNAYARKIYVRKNLNQLIPLDPCRMRISQAETGELTYQYRYRSGQDLILPQAEVLHLRGLSADGVQGYSVLEIMSPTFQYALAQQEYGLNFYKNYAQPGGVIKYPTKLDDKAKKNLKESWQKLHTGANAYKVAVLEEGMSWEQVGISNKDAQFLEGRSFQISEIARIFRVPPHLIGDLSKATFSNIEQQSLDFIVNTLRPWLVRCEQAIWRDLLNEPEKQNLFAEFLVDGMLRGDLAARYAAYVQGLTNGFLSADEVRAFENLNPIPDGSGQIFRVPLNLAPSNEVDDSNTLNDDSNNIPAKDDSITDTTPAQRSRLKEAFSIAFNDIYQRAIRRELKSAKKGPEAESKHKDFVAENLKSVIQGYLTELAERNSLSHRIGEQSFERFSKSAAEHDRNLSAKYFEESPEVDILEYKSTRLWDIITTEIDLFLGL